MALLLIPLPLKRLLRDSMSGTELRLFLGITAPEALLEALPALREEVGNPPGLRWVPEENLHLTVLLSGECSGRNASQPANDDRA
jgi:2'-5' RNA ligase